ncbi:hypothetical protein, variant [Aphanomyces invadans]|uniref:Uncharacterized protein n=1 Tax=Aphanomyces invadans TaxID=157072 RepID=A0A024UC38_9STRA|nr:hypothetical protein, variant [Aphanomyces invadans]ETW03961.1 hypothetical protein, variant [Aphanomyces invadans]|eukprot:XP_008866917.1 hypothetical protein, variant [Aphanomyces invadans]
MMLCGRVRAVAWIDVGAATRAFSYVSIPAADTKKRGLPQLQPDRFKVLANACLTRVESALKPLHPPVNDVFVVSRTSNPDSLLLSLAAHEFQLKVLVRSQKIELESPVRTTR